MKSKTKISKKKKEKKEKKRKIPERNRSFCGRRLTEEIADSVSVVDDGNEKKRRKS